MLHLLGDGLVAFEPIGGTNARLVPDLATSIPTPTDGGRTYTFELRSGIRYSNGEVVAPADFRRCASNEGFRLDSDAHEDLYGGLVGGEACGNEPRTCDLSEGIVTDDASGTITFHLVAPDPEFLYKLTMPFAYPVPPSVPDEEQVASGHPGHGPLHAGGADDRRRARAGSQPVTSASGRRRHSPTGTWTGSSGRSGSKPEAQVEAVAAGDADLAFDRGVLRTGSKSSSCGSRRRSTPLRTP